MISFFRAENSENFEKKNKIDINPEVRAILLQVQFSISECAQVSERIIGLTSFISNQIRDLMAQILQEATNIQSVKVATSTFNVVQIPIPLSENQVICIDALRIYFALLWTMIRSFYIHLDDQQVINKAIAVGSLLVKIKNVLEDAALRSLNEFENIQK